MKANPKFHPQMAYLRSVLDRSGIDWVEEITFHPTRKWRFDLAIPSIKLGIEYNGINFGGGGGHSSILGMTRDSEKMNQAILHGWRVVSFTKLHFDQKDRTKHNLQSPETTIFHFIAQALSEQPISQPTPTT